MKTHITLFVLCLLSIGARPTDAATTLTFDEFPLAPGASSPMPAGYGGLQWDNFHVFNVLNLPATSGYRIGLISQPTVALNGFGDDASISSQTGFNLHSAYLTAALDTRAGVVEMHVRVQGRVGTNVTYDNTYTVSNTAPTLIQFNYVGVDRVIFVASPEAQFALDNLSVTVPEPGASCTYVVSPRSRRHNFVAETGSVTVATQPGCNWSVVNPTAWVTILSSLKNTGSGTVTYAVEAAPAGASRTGYVNIAGQTFEVSQAAPPANDCQTLTFEELLPLLDQIEEAYGGVLWENFGVLDSSVFPVTSGYRIGIVSPDNVAFNRFGNSAAIRSELPFTLKSAFLTWAQDVRVERGGTPVRVQGSLGSTLLYDHSYIISNTAPTLIDFNYVGVDRVVFFTTSSIFAMDNVSMTLTVDSDRDGVLDPEDQCPNTPPGAVVNEHGCSLEQMVPCDGTWKNHGQYVSAMVQAAAAFESAGRITKGEQSAIIRAAAQSDCGKRKQ